MPYLSLSFGQAKDRALDRVGSEVFWLDVEAGSAVNEAICVWQALTGSWTFSIDIPVTSGHFYTTPGQIVSPQRILWNDTPLTLGSQEEMDYGNPGWEGTTGTPTTWMPLGISLFALYPAPLSGTITIEGYAEAPVLGSDGEFVDLGDEHLNDVMGYAEHVLCFKEGTTEQSSSQGLYQAFVAAAADENSTIRTLNVYKNAMGLPRDEAERSSESNKVIGARL